eukprot:evm.model.scf_1207.6 EVM.evm.TU.scf_1207.6   scf_1207:34568-36963(-)
MAGRLLYRIGKVVRETGQALERLGCTAEGGDAFKEEFFRHRSVMNLETVKPTLGSSVFIAPNAAVIGDVKINSKASVWYGCIIRGDENPVEIGNCTNIQDGSTVGGMVTESPIKSPTKIGNNVTVGHGATLVGCTIEDECLVGMGATLLHGSKMETGSMVAAGAVVPPGAVVPTGQLWGGNPGRVLRPLKPNEAEHLSTSAVKYSELAAEHLSETSKLVDAVKP